VLKYRLCLHSCEAGAICKLELIIENESLKYITLNLKNMIYMNSNILSDQALQIRNEETGLCFFPPYKPGPNLKIELPAAKE
jgi:hypothetical protein